MSKKAATTDELAALHATVAQTLVEDLSVKDEPEAEIELRIARLKQRHDARAHAIAFLKNNNITAASDSEDLAALQRELSKQRSSRSEIPQAALDEAAEAFGQRLQ